MVGASRGTCKSGNESILRCGVMVTTPTPENITTNEARNHVRPGRRAGIISVSAVLWCALFSFIGTGTAHADTERYTVVSDEKGNILGAGIGSDQSVGTCDMRRDGLGVRTHYTLRNGSVGVVGDADGSGENCFNQNVGTGDSPVVYIMTCAGKNGADTYCSPRVAV